MAKGGKHARAAHSPVPGKHARAAAVPPPEHDGKPVWRFGQMDFGGPFSWAQADTETLAKVFKKLGNFETMTWSEIAIDGKNSHHSISLEDCSTAAQNRATALNLAVDQVFSFRLEGKVRVFGIRDRWICSLLWYDPKHAVCPSTLKHT